MNLDSLTEAERKWILALIAAAVEEKRRFIATATEVAAKLQGKTRG